jgi:hypothetical protein
LGKKFFEDYKIEAVEKFMEYFAKMDLLDIERHDQLGKIKIDTSIKNIDISDISFDPVETDIKLSEKVP